MPKTDIRIEANGVLDELNTAIGMVRAEMPTEHEWQNSLKEVQLKIMKLMSGVASLPDMPESVFSSQDADLIENLIDEIERNTSPSDYFILPGGTRISSLFHFARVAARRAERSLYHLEEQYPLPQTVFPYINRLSDLFFVMGRKEQEDSGLNEERWKMFRARRSAD